MTTLRVARRRLTALESTKMPLQVAGLIGIEMDPDTSVLKGFFLQERFYKGDGDQVVDVWVDVPVVDIPDAQVTSPPPAKQRLDEGDKPA